MEWDRGGHGVSSCREFSQGKELLPTDDYSRHCVGLPEVLNSAADMYHVALQPCNGTPQMIYGGSIFVNFSILLFSLQGSPQPTGDIGCAVITTTHI